MKNTCTLLLLLSSYLLLAQSAISYEVDLDRRHYHEARIRVTVNNISGSDISFKMSRSSPGRYALHEFAKNVYGVTARDGKGSQLQIDRPDPHQWDVKGHDGTVILEYTLFANRGDGTYSQFDPTHAHMNMPATFMWPEGMDTRPVRLKVEIPAGSNWKVASQLKKEDNGWFSAPNLYYFLDSPTEVSNFMLRSFNVTDRDRTYAIELALHHQGTEAEADEYFESVKKIVVEQGEIFGAFPQFENDRYTFLACYMPNVSGDGMEHRNSTIVTSTRTLAQGGMKRNLGTISHEFFHAWNVERIRPASLEPFDFSRANMSGELWFAEGFTSYYTGLVLCRAGLNSEKEYIKGLGGTLNAVINGKGRMFFSPVEMSYMAPFVDAARSVDPTNFSNTFISYYTYGSALGLGLDLMLRLEGKSLDGYMSHVWNSIGSKEVPYELSDLEDLLSEYISPEFAGNYFNNFIHGSHVPDYRSLLAEFGVVLRNKFPGTPFLGVSIDAHEQGWEIASLPAYNGPADLGGLLAGDVITEVGNRSTAGVPSADILSERSPGEELKISYIRGGKLYSTTVTLGERNELEILLMEETGVKPDRKAIDNRNSWLGKK